MSIVWHLANETGTFIENDGVDRYVRVVHWRRNKLVSSTRRLRKEIYKLRLAKSWRKRDDLHSRNLKL